jgi:hypothetical protein
MKVGDIIVHLGYGECELIRQTVNGIFDAIMIRRPDKEIKIRNINAAILREKYLSVGDMVYSPGLGHGIIIRVPTFKEDEYRVDFLNGLGNEKCVIGEFEENTIKLCKKAIVPFVEGDIVYDRVQKRRGIIREVMTQKYDRFYHIEFDIGVREATYENFAALTLNKIIVHREIDIFSLDGIIS